VRISLPAKLLIPQAFLVITVLGVVLFFTLHLTRSLFYDHYLNSMQSTNHIVKSSLTQWIKNQIDFTEALSKDHDILNLLKHPRNKLLQRHIEKHLKNLHTSLGYFENIVVIPKLAEGEIITRQVGERSIEIRNGGALIDTVDGRTIGKGSIALPFIYKALVKGETTISDPYPSFLRGYPIFVIITPVKDSAGEILGTILIALKLPYFSDKFTNLGTVGGWGSVLIADKNGHLLAHPEKREILERNLFETPIYNACKSLHEPMHYYEDEKSALHIHCTKEPLTGWHVIVQGHDAKIQQAFQNIRNTMTIVIGVAIVILIILGQLAISALALKPIHKLRRAIEGLTYNTPVQEELCRNSSKEIASLFESFKKMATTLQERDDVIQKQARFDMLTSLPNRLYLSERLDSEIAHALRNETQIALLFLDLDNFKLINDTLGHDIGDTLLKEVSRRLGRIITSPKDMIARLGGDEFVILLTDYDFLEYPAEIADQIIRILRQECRIEGHHIMVSTSIGIALLPDDAQDKATLLKNADIAMYEAKNHGRDGYQFFNPQMHRTVKDELELEQEMQHSLKADAFFLLYQPRIEAKTGKISGMEALIRWNHPRRGLVSPIEFIHLAESTGFILPLGRWIIFEACQMLREWQDAGFTHIMLSLNVSIRQFQHGSLVDDLKEAIEITGINAHCLEIEITEGLFLSHLDKQVQTLNAIKALGVRVAMDDFGTGYSSLSYLKHLPIDTLKIDRSFVKELPNNAIDKGLAKTIIQLAKGLDLEVVAEGVETQEQVDYLRTEGCDTFQGFFFDKPLDSATMTLRLRQQSIIDS